MQFFGGKAKIAKEVVEVLKSYRYKDQPFVEPFCGSVNIVSKMTGNRFASDGHYELIEMWKALQQGWIPPDVVTKEDYDLAKAGNVPPYLKAFIGFGCSFSGKYFGGYARNKRERNYAKDAVSSINKKLSGIQGVKFSCHDYRDLLVEDCLIYSDPPYGNTTGYSVKFNSEEFWDWARHMSIYNTLIISEYSAPEDFKCIWQKNVHLDIRNKDNKLENRVEKLFVMR